MLSKNVDILADDIKVQDQNIYNPFESINIHF